jgi:two-component system NtrC family response regulator
VPKDKKFLLVVDDSRGIQKQLRWAFPGFEVVTAGDREDAIAQFRRVEPGVVLLDLGLPPDPGGVTEGLATLQEILSLVPETRVIVITGDNDRTNAVKAIQLGACDFYQKPVYAELLALMVNRANTLYQLEVENRQLQRPQLSSPLAGILASSPVMLDVCRTVQRIAPVDITTLLRGASGTGKERFAQAIHSLSPRSKLRMVAINCAAIPDNLLESELFGHEIGAFTGASRQSIGKIEHADGGTLFLDEIGDLPMDLQSKLLRFLQERVVERVGGRVDIPVDVRIVCATHQDLEKQISAGRFREDLYYRISEFTVNIPPLRDRDGDVLMLARSFLNRYSSELGRSLKGFDQAALHAIEAHNWPGNVRELESRVKRATIMASGSYVRVEDLELDDDTENIVPLDLRTQRDEVERRTVVLALERSNQNAVQAANELGIARPTLYKLLIKHEIEI